MYSQPHLAITHRLLPPRGESSPPNHEHANHGIRGLGLSIPGLVAMAMNFMNLPRVTCTVAGIYNHIVSSTGSEPVNHKGDMTSRSRAKSRDDIMALMHVAYTGSDALPLQQDTDL